MAGKRPLGGKAADVAGFRVSEFFVLGSQLLVIRHPAAEPPAGDGYWLLVIGGFVIGKREWKMINLPSPITNNLSPITGPPPPPWSLALGHFPFSPFAPLCLCPISLTSSPFPASPGLRCLRYLLFKSALRLHPQSPIPFALIRVNSRLKILLSSLLVIGAWTLVILPSPPLPLCHFAPLCLCPHLPSHPRPSEFIRG